MGVDQPDLAGQEEERNHQRGEGDRHQKQQAAEYPVLEPGLEDLETVARHRRHQQRQGRADDRDLEGIVEDLRDIVRGDEGREVLGQGRSRPASALDDIGGRIGGTDDHPGEGEDGDEGHDSEEAIGRQGSERSHFRSLAT